MSDAHIYNMYNALVLKSLVSRLQLFIQKIMKIVWLHNVQCVDISLVHFAIIRHWSCLAHSHQNPVGKHVDLNNGDTSISDYYWPPEWPNTRKVQTGRKESGPGWISRSCLVVKLQSPGYCSLVAGLSTSSTHPPLRFDSHNDPAKSNIGCLAW